MEERFGLADRILDHVADTIVCADRSGAIIRWNRAAAALFGYSAEEMLGQHRSDHSRASAAHRGGFEAAMRCRRGTTRDSGVRA